MTIPSSSRIDSEASVQPIIYGFQRSTYVNIVRLVLTHKQVPFRFVDLEGEMGGERHLSLHPFGRVPALEHEGLRLFEASAIVHYLDERFPDPPLTPAGQKDRARMHQWISAVNAYYYPWIVYHLVHERLVFPPLGIAPDEKVVAAAMPKIEQCLFVLDRAFEDGRKFLLGPDISLADFFLYPSLFALSLTGEGEAMLTTHISSLDWLNRMNALPTVKVFRAAMPLPEPIEHARSWVDGHRPKY